MVVDDLGESRAVSLQFSDALTKSRLIQPKITTRGQHAKALVEQTLTAGDIASQESRNFVVAMTSVEYGLQCRLEFGMVELARNSQ